MTTENRKNQVVYLAEITVMKLHGELRGYLTPIIVVTNVPESKAQEVKEQVNKKYELTRLADSLKVIKTFIRGKEELKGISCSDSDVDKAVKGELTSSFGWDITRFTYEEWVDLVNKR